MEQNTKRLLNYFKKHGGIARFSSIIKAGFHSDTLSALEKEGKIALLDLAAIITIKQIGHVIIDGDEVRIVNIEVGELAICRMSHAGICQAFHLRTEGGITVGSSKCRWCKGIVIWWQEDVMGVA